MAEDSPPKNKKCYFWRMPQDILDDIFQLAYGTNESHKLIDRDFYYMNANLRRRRNEPAPYNHVQKVNEFLVSKRWFHTAAAAWANAQKWEWRHIWSIRNMPFFAHFASTLTATVIDEDDVQKIEKDSAWLLGQQIDLEFVLWGGELDSQARGLEQTQHKYETADIGALPIVRTLEVLRGVKQLALIPTPSLAPPMNQTYKYNILAVTDFVAPIVAQPRKGQNKSELSLQEPGGPTPLYIGSRVTADTKELLPADYYNYLTPDYDTDDGKGHPYEVTEKYLRKEGDRDGGNKRSDSMVEAMGTLKL